MCPRAGPIWSQGHTLNRLGSGLLGDATYQTSMLLALCLRQEDFVQVFPYISFHLTCEPETRHLI